MFFIAADNKYLSSEVDRLLIESGKTPRTSTQRLVDAALAFVPIGKVGLALGKVVRPLQLFFARSGTFIAGKVGEFWASLTIANVAVKPVVSFVGNWVVRAASGVGGLVSGGIGRIVAAKGNPIRAVAQAVSGSATARAASVSSRYAVGVAKVGLAAGAGLEFLLASSAVKAAGTILGKVGVTSKAAPLIAREAKFYLRTWGVKELIGESSSVQGEVKPDAVDRFRTVRAAVRTAFAGGPVNRLFYGASTVGLIANNRGYVTRSDVRQVAERQAEAVKDKAVQIINRPAPSPAPSPAPAPLVVRQPEVNPVVKPVVIFNRSGVNR